MINTFFNLYKTKIYLGIFILLFATIGFYVTKHYLYISSLESKITKQETTINNLNTTIKTLNNINFNKDFETKWLSNYSNENYTGAEYETIKYPDSNGTIIKFK